MLRVSATDVEQLRYYRNSEWMEFEELVARFKSSEETLQMRAGTAFHSLLEHMSDFNGDWCEQDGFVFRFNMDAAIALPEVREVKIEKTFLVGGEEVTLVAKSDGITGRRVCDHKLTEKFDAENYTDSLQWRIYLVLFDADSFTYNVFEGGEVRRTKENDRLFPGKTVWDIDDLHQLTVYRYEGIERDVMRGLEDFVEFARVHLPERFGQGAEKAFPI